MRRITFMILGLGLALAPAARAGDWSKTYTLTGNPFSADLDLRTGDGHIDLDLPVTVEGRLGPNKIRGKLNGGGKPLTIHTGDGSIRLQKS